MGAPITVPVGTKTLGRIFNVLGVPVDEMGSCDAPSGLPIHRASPSFTDLETKPAIFETGIKVVDILAPYSKKEKEKITTQERKIRTKEKEKKKKKKKVKKKKKKKKK